MVVRRILRSPLHLMYMITLLDEKDGDHERKTLLNSDLNDPNLNGCDFFSNSRISRQTSLPWTNQRLPAL